LKVMTHTKEEQEVGRANKRPTSEQKTALHHRNKEITEKKMGDRRIDLLG